MREIKFRAWDGKWNVMYYSHGEPYGVYLFHEEWMIATRFDNGYGDKAGDVDIDGKDYHLMQYTGLKDKNGKEIYEGDIVGYKKQVVTMKYGKWMMINDQDLQNKILFDCLSDDPENTFVIGNIYENPELLK